MSEASEIREKKLAELREKYAQQQQEEQQKQQAEQQIESMLKRFLSPEAKARLKNVKLVNEQLYWNVVQQLLVLARSGRLQGKISDEQAKKILKSLSQKREISIKRK